MTINLEGKMTRVIVCIDCGEEKEYGARGRCESCYHRNHYRKHRKKILAANQQWLNEHREQYRQYKNQYNQEHREKHRIYVKKWYQDHREEVLARSADWAQQNPEQYIANQKHWREENPERRAAIEARRKARKENLPDTLTEKQREQLLFIGQATFPGEDLHLDHVIPLKHGGGTTFANTHYIPGILNSFKKDRLPEEIYEQLELCQ